MRMDAFISYRRDGGYLMAQLLREILKNKGINCYLDLEEERSGQFDLRLLDAIENSSNFLLVLTKGALDRCVHTDDWVRREIVEATHRGKHIIPVRYPDFEWPKNLNEDFPMEIKRLENEQGVILRPEYLQASVEKIINVYMVDVKSNDKAVKYHREYTNTEEFFRQAIAATNERIAEINMAFRGGSEWHQKVGLVNVLLQAIENKTRIRVLINAGETVEPLSVHMRQPLKKYYGYNKSIQDWAEKMEMYPDIFQIRIANIPLMHRYYCVKNEQTGLVKVSFYTYGNYNPKRDFQYTFDANCEEYGLYETEFEYIWNEASEPLRSDKS